MVNEINETPFTPNNKQEDEDVYRFTPKPAETDRFSGKHRWDIKGYRIWATSYEEALKHLAIIESL